MVFPNMVIKLNENLRLGNVISIVEGDKTERIILQSVFCDLLSYNITFYDKHNDEVLVFKKYDDKYSHIYVVPYKNSAIVSLEKKKII